MSDIETLRAKLAIAENELVRIQYADDFCFSHIR